MAGAIIQTERIFPVTADRLWAALTDPSEMKQWYFDVPEFKAEVGNEFSFTGHGRTGEKFIHNCRVIEVVPGKKIVYSWAYEGKEGYSEVCFELFPADSSTKLVLTHTGTDSFEKNGPDFAVESFTEGWNYIVNTSLKNYLS
jgi:uncharacterized protein YndB with AHSA1/START domain